MLIKINKDHKIKIYKHGDDRRLVISWSLSGERGCGLETSNLSLLVLVSVLVMAVTDDAFFFRESLWTRHLRDTIP